MNKEECGKKTEVYSRVVGYYRPIQNWNRGKRHEFDLRKTFKLNAIYKEMEIERMRAMVDQAINEEVERLERIARLRIIVGEYLGESKSAFTVEH